RPRANPPLFPYPTLFRSLLPHGGIGWAVGDLIRVPVPAGRAQGRLRGSGVVVGEHLNEGRHAHAQARLEQTAVQGVAFGRGAPRSEEHTSELQSLTNLVC